MLDGITLASAQPVLHRATGSVSLEGVSKMAAVSRLRVPQGLKPLIDMAFWARLKSCPDTMRFLKHALARAVSIADAKSGVVEAHHSK
jgi:hypothetical protein